MMKTLPQRFVRIAARIRGRFSWGGLILLYHRVAAVKPDPWKLCVSPDHFAEHLEVLRKTGELARLTDLDERRERPHPSPRCIAITFDDGYADNLASALPLLERFEAPATIFVTTHDESGGSRTFWWDDLADLLLGSAHLPEAVTLTISGVQRTWTIHGLDSSHMPQSERLSWSPLEAPPGSARERLFLELYAILQRLPNAERNKVLDQLKSQSNAGGISEFTHRRLTEAELERLNRNELIEIGAHTVTHPLLTELSLTAQEHEIRQSKAALEKVIGQPVVSFSYPHGATSPDTVRIVRKRGFRRACATTSELVRRRTDPYRMPRIMVEDWDGEEFSRRLRQWLTR